MPRYEYKVVPAPTKGLKGKGVKGAEARFSHAIQELMNGLAGYGWEYQRAETLPSLERSGLTSTTTEWRNVLVFRRLRDNDAEVFAPELLPPPEKTEPAPEPEQVETPEPVAEKASDVSEKTEKVTAEKDDTLEEKTAPAEEMPPASSKSETDNGVEDTSETAGIASTLTKFAKGRKASKTDA